MTDPITTAISPARIVLAWTPDGQFKGGDLVSVVTVTQGVTVISRSETALVPIQGTVQDGIPLAPLLGDALAAAVAQVGVLTNERDTIKSERDALKSQLAALTEEGHA